ncbi:hypothetical protein [Streptomyces sp. NPDC057623]|uniref:hypothetical protein n=1 Tax=Streptomyces sp. NPDC057623 TaxID=3346187 RepID=UPI0036C1925E
MPLFRRALWPQDHRDELVAGALVGAVVVVLGYASGIGAPATASDAIAAPPPTATSPSSPGEPAAPQAPGDDPGAVAGGGAGTGALPVTGVYYPGGTGTGHAGHTGASGGTGASHAGHGASPAPSDSGRPSSPSPSAPGTTPPADSAATCEDGEVRLAGPLLTGLTEPVLGLLAPGAEASPTPQVSPCVGLAPLPSLLGGISPSPEATP